MATPLWADELARRGMMGVMLGPINEQLKTELGLESTEGVVLTRIVPDGTAQKAGLQVNDVVIKVGDQRIKDVPSSTATLRNYRAGDTVKLTIIRDKKEITAEVGLNPRPKETSEEYDIVYDSAGETGKRVRTIITKPKGDGKYPAILFVQAPTPFPIEFGGFPHPYKPVVENFTKQGLVVMRVERFGYGDSDGTDGRDTRLADDQRAFREALAKLRKYEFVDSDNVFVLGHSLGGFIAPTLGQGQSVKGVATYGAFARPWLDHAMDSYVRKWKFELLKDDEITAKSDKMRTFLKACILGKQSPADVVAKHPELKEFVAEICPDGRTIDGVPYEMSQEWAALDLEDAWGKVDASVLAIWGESDFIAGKECSELIVKTVNKSHPGKATLMVMPGTDHMFHKAEDQEESFLAGFGGSYNSAVGELLLKWIKERGGKSS